MKNLNKGWKKTLLGFGTAAFILMFLIPFARAEDQWSIRINIPEYKLYLYNGVDVYQCYPIAVGKTDSPSPTGDFVIINKVSNPTWYPPDHKRTPIPSGPNNPLGMFWLGLNIDGYGIHGNSAPWSIGSPISLGCFRMRNQDIEQLFNLVPVGTPVTITYRTMLGGLDPLDQAWLEVFPDIYHREDPEEELGSVFSNLHWTFQPHQKALDYLLSITKRPCKIQVPRVIKITGDITGIDGFYWNGMIYVSKNILASLPVSIIPGIENGLFSDYLDLIRLTNLGGLQINWDETANTLTLSHGLIEASPPPSPPPGY